MIRPSTWAKWKNPRTLCSITLVEGAIGQARPNAGCRAGLASRPRLRSTSLEPRKDVSLRVLVGSLVDSSPRRSLPQRGDPGSR